MASEAAPAAATQPVTAKPPQPSEGPNRGYRLAWAVVAGAAVIVGLIGGVFTLLDRVPGPPQPTATPVPTTPSISVEVDTAAGAAEFVEFAGAHVGELVDLDVRCIERPDRSPCFSEGSGISVDLATGPEYMFMWLFTGEPCFSITTQDRDFHLCQGEALLWVDPRTQGSPADVGNITGAGSVAITGPWYLKRTGAAFFGTDVQGFELTAFRR
jgi:hypothetical protein